MGEHGEELFNGEFIADIKRIFISIGTHSLQKKSLWFTAIDNYFDALLFHWDKSWIAMRKFADFYLKFKDFQPLGRIKAVGVGLLLLAAN